MVGSGPKVPAKVSQQRFGEQSIGYQEFNKHETAGRGGYAVVYRATVGESDQQVALKEPETESPGKEALRDDLTERFIDEADLWADLDDHECIVDVISYAKEPHPWIALDYIDCELRDRIGTVESSEALWYGVCVAKAVRYAHRHGVAHYDLNPDNVLLRESMYQC